jgi:hypothetical protein
MGMGEFLYPQVGVGMGVGKILLGGYGCGWPIPNGFVPIAISNGNSAVVINQVNKSWDCNKENMDAYFLEVCKLENKFYGLEFHHVVRDNNVAADVLSKLGSTRAQVPSGIFVHELHAPSIPELAPLTTVLAHPPAGQEVMMIDVDWRQPFIDYLSEQKVPSDKNLVEQLIRRAKSYVLVGDKLYR